jgi:RNA polymerase sigma-70 factor (ECF subfamily)
MKHIGRTFLRVKLESKLLLQGGEDRWAVGIDRGRFERVWRPPGSLIRRPRQVDVEGAVESGSKAARTELAVVRAALRTLPANDREALLLRLAGELSVDQIATVMHTTPAAVKMRMSRARRRLAALLSERSDGR